MNSCPQNWRDREAGTKKHNLLEQKPRGSNLHESPWELALGQGNLSSN